jgi:UDP-glucose 4-epimerase
MCEQMILDFQKAYGLKAAILRYFNVIGEDPDGEVYEDHDPETHVVPNLLKALDTGKNFELYGTQYNTPDGSAVRDYVDVNDLAQVHLAAINEVAKRSSFVSNIGGGRGYSVREVFAAVSEVFESKPMLVEKPARPGDPPRLVADPKFFRTWYKAPLQDLTGSLRTMRSNMKRGRR